MTQTERQKLEQIFDDLFPICRSITGPGIEASLEYCSKTMPMTIEKVASGTQVFDWTVPQEWHFRSAKLVGPDGDLICDADEHNLSVVNYSEPVCGTFSLNDLQCHLHSLPHLPHAIPYVTSYYKRNWGFCLPHSKRVKLKPGQYRVDIQSKFVDGGVPYGYAVLPGESEKEILLTSYLCHPSMANNELSGPLVLMGLYNRLKAWSRRRYTYRFLLNPETIGSLCFLHRHASHLKHHMVAGLILTCLGGPKEQLRFKCSRRGDGLLDKLVKSNEQLPFSYQWESFSPLFGSDERQYCAPGFNLPITQAARTVYGEYDGYHNSLDDKAFMDIGQVQSSIEQIEAMLLTAEVAGYAVNQCPFGEPQLGKRNLYPNVNSGATWSTSNDKLSDGRTFLNAVLSILSDTDGHTSMLEIAKRCGLTLSELRPVIERLEAEKLIRFNAEPLF